MARRKKAATVTKDGSGCSTHKGRPPKVTTTTSTAVDLLPLSTIQEALARLKSLADAPESFCGPPPELAESLTQVLKAVFDHARKTQPIKLGPLQELLVDGFDTETVWEQLQLRNPAVRKFVAKVTRRLLEKEKEEGGELVVMEEEEKEEKESEGEKEEKSEREEEEDARMERLVGESEEESEGEEDDDDDDDDDDDEEDEEEGSADVSDDEEGEEESPIAKSGGKKGGKKKDAPLKKEALNDGFFDWDEMEKFADEMEEEEFNDDDDEEESDDDDEEEEEEEEEEEGGEGEGGGKEIRYKDFFGDGEEEREEEEGEEEEEEEEEDANFGALVPSSKKTKKVLARNQSRQAHDEAEDGDMEEEEDEEEEEEGREDELEEESVDPKTLTSFQRQQRAKRKEIAELEYELLSERPWELRGEVKAVDRPENSLLEAVVDVELARRPEVLMTVEKSQSIEEMIKQRVMEERWNDVVPKALGEEVMMNRRKGGREGDEELPEVSQEKSTEGLGAIYEKEYMRLAMGQGGGERGEKETTESREKVEMAGLFRLVCGKLDALSNFNFTPKAARVEMTVQANVPAIAMEEVLPLAVGHADTQAPEEVHGKKRGKEGVLREAAELDQGDRQRLRRDKKVARRKARKQTAVEEKLVDRLNPGLGNKYAKEKMRSEIKASGKVVQGTLEAASQGGAYSTSGKFFAGLQEEVSAHGGAYAKRKATEKGQETAKELARTAGGNRLKL